MASNAMFGTGSLRLRATRLGAGMLLALMDGRALTASELAHVARITRRQGKHISRATAVGLLSVEKQGRHRYHRLHRPGGAMTNAIRQVP